MKPFLINMQWVASVALALLVGGHATAQDPVAVDPGHYKVLLENQRIRVVDFKDKPGDKSPMHSHPDYVVYVVNAFKRKLSFPDGTTKNIGGKAGEAFWQPAQTHAGENTGTTDTHVLFFELKEATQPADRQAAEARPNYLGFNFKDLKWDKMFAELGKDSPEIAMLRVDPNTKASQLLIRTPTAMHVPKHWHSANETHTVISGQIAFECEGKRETLGPGSFNYIPSKMIHQAWTSAGHVVFITVDSAWDINWVEGPPKASDVGVIAPAAKQQ